MLLQDLQLSDSGSWDVLLRGPAVAAVLATAGHVAAAAASALV
jgi:hypothetical protein